MTTTSIPRVSGVTVDHSDLVQAMSAIAERDSGARRELERNLGYAITFDERHVETVMNNARFWQEFLDRDAALLERLQVALDLAWAGE